jgi:hypothetical protein
VDTGIRGEPDHSFAGMPEELGKHAGRSTTDLRHQPAGFCNLPPAYIVGRVESREERGHEISNTRAIIAGRVSRELHTMRPRLVAKHHLWRHVLDLDGRQLAINAAPVFC